jgi:hypothetical protein
MKPDLSQKARDALAAWWRDHPPPPPLEGTLVNNMNVADLVDAFGLPRNYAERLPAGSSIIATVKPDGSVAVEIQPPPRGPGRPPKAISE